MNKTHGHSRAGNGHGSPTYLSWMGMKARCGRENSKDYEDYGGRGITVCDRWQNSFENFLDDMGERPEDTTLDRIDYDGDYTPENCRWADAATQNGNKANARWITFNGETHTIAEWNRRMGGAKSTLRNRLNKYGWSVEKALTTPVRPRSAA